jgi:hypothetical protein
MEERLNGCSVLDSGMVMVRLVFVVGKLLGEGAMIAIVRRIDRGLLRGMNTLLPMGVLRIEIVGWNDGESTRVWVDFGHPDRPFLTFVVAFPYRLSGTSTILFCCHRVLPPRFLSASVEA